MKTLMVTREAGLEERRWYVLNAQDAVLGRLAVKAATLLRGKHKPNFTPHEDTGDFVIVVNAERVKLTGNKVEDKMYRRHTGYPGGLRERTAREYLALAPEEMVREAVVGMLPKNRLGRRLATKLKVYAGEQHPHEAQQPVELSL
ncbi:MAG TPA: 50S ribosomal protein L13 [Terriglobales bacterium]|nr:50S ribosomal protein L13 [Terriglobales bacterium]